VCVCSRAVLRRIQQQQQHSTTDDDDDDNRETNPAATSSHNNNNNNNSEYEYTPSYQSTLGESSGGGRVGWPRLQSHTTRTCITQSHI
jgi:hypothetical protein